MQKNRKKCFSKSRHFYCVVKKSWWMLINCKWNCICLMNKTTDQTIPNKTNGMRYWMKLELCLHLSSSGIDSYKFNFKHILIQNWSLVIFQIGLIWSDDVLICLRLIYRMKFETARNTTDAKWKAGYLLEARFIVRKLFQF